MREEREAAGARSRDRKPAKGYGEDQDQDGAESKVGEGEASERNDAEEAVRPAIAMESGEDAGGKAKGHPNKQSGKGQFEGIGIPLNDEVEDGVVEAEGLAEVGVNEASPISSVLGGERLVEAVGVAECGDVGGGGTFTEHLGDRVAGDEMDKEEDDGDNKPQNGQGGEKTAKGWGEGHTLWLTV